MRLFFILLFWFVFYLNSAVAMVYDLKVKGIVTDSISQSPIENASIQLFFENKLQKSTLSRYDGSFSFSALKAGNYILTVSHIGYKSQSETIKVDEGILPEIGIKLMVEQVELSEITVKANRPLVVQKNGEVIYQIEGGIWQNSGNAMNIINRIPILKGRSGSNYLLYGTKVVFLLDGKPIESAGVSLEAILSNLSTSDIDNLEILQSPPPSLARFGRPIVNIKTIKQKNNGSLLALNHGYGRGKNDRFNNGLRYSFKENNLILGISALQSQINQVSKINTIKESPNLEYIDNEMLKSKSNLYDVKFTGEYSKSKFGYINFSVGHKNFATTIHRNLVGNYSLVNKIDNITLNSNSNSNGIQNLAGIDYNKKFSDYFNIRSSVEIGQYEIKNKENISVSSQEQQSNFTNPWSRKITFQNYYFENETKLGELKLTSGVFLKSSKSDTDFIKNVGNTDKANNNFQYQENNFSAFISSNYAKGKTNITAGLNLEHSDIKGVSNSDNQNLNFYSFLPNLSINYQINDSKSINLSYNRGITRPEYEWLNQQELYKNPYNNQIGGGVLLPTIYNKVTVSNTFAGGLTLTGIYSNQKNRYSFFPFVAANNIISYSAINIENFYYLYYSASYQKYLNKIWYLATDVSGYYSNLKSPIYNIKNSGYTQQFSISNYLIFKKLGQFGLTSSYNTTDFADSYRFLPQFTLNIEYSKSIFRKNGTINISYSDITNSLKDRYVYKISNFSAKDSYKNETRLLKFSLNYKLGNKNVKEASPRNQKAETEIERLK